MQIFDNIGCSCIVSDNDFVLLGALPGYNNLNTSHIGYTIPYLVRNIKNNNIQWEIGSGLISYKNSQILISNRVVVSSSNNNSPVSFDTDGNKEFYLFVNSMNFNTGFNNVVIHNDNFSVDTKKTTYIVDTSSGYIVAALPDCGSTEALELEFKVVGSGVLQINSMDGNFSVRLDQNNTYAKIVSTGKYWLSLIDLKQSTEGVSVQSNEFRAMSDPSGVDRAIQYNNNGVFDGSSMYYGNNEKILFGSSDETQAKNIIPASGNFDTIFNQTKNDSNFIVNGKYNAPNYPSKNFIFTYDGKFGLNMPSGITPATIVHIINNSCSEDMRLENKASADVCDNPVHLSLYKNPYVLSNGDNKQIGKVSFSAKNASGLRVSYADISAKTKSISNNQGEINFNVKNNLVDETTISTNPEKTIIKHNNANISLSSVSGAITVPGCSISCAENKTNISSSGVGSNITLSSNNIYMNGSVSISSGLQLPYINQSDVLLGLDSYQRIVATTGFKIPGVDGSNNKLLTTTNDGTVVAEYSVDSFWPYETGVKKLGGKDLVWDRYESRTANTCLNKLTREIEFTELPSIGEFSVGDQIAISYDDQIIYRTVEEIVVSGDLIIGLLIDSEIQVGGNIEIFSITKGGVLTNTIYTSGIVSDASSVIVSTRPGVATVFNTTSKNINFQVYGVESQPALSIIANAATEPTNLGQYFQYATQLNFSDNRGIQPIPVKIQSNGFGIAGDYNTANFQLAAGDDIASWSGMVSAVGTNGKKSYYGTYDQNGNVYEWIEDEEKISSSNTTQYICGGSWRTLDPVALRSYIPTPRLSGLDDIGFRICSKAGFVDSNVDSLLSLNFIRVDDPNNLPDTGVLFTEEAFNRFDLLADPQPITKNNLGVVEYSYNISDKEITNTQYVEFLQAVASVAPVDYLYSADMSLSAVGGITRSGSGTNLDPYVYSTKAGMANMPVVFVNYISVIRFINWLNNGAPIGENVPEGVTENGAYNITQHAGVTYITKNSKSKYWLPTLNEWHKAAYFQPSVGSLGLTNTSAITIRQSTPFEYAPGSVSSLSVGGNLYADSVNIGPTGESIFNSTQNNGNFKLGFGPTNTVIETEGNFAGSYGSYISNTGIVFATSGNTLFINKINPLNVVNITPTGTYLYGGDLYISSGLGDGGVKISASGGLEYIDSSGSVVPGGMFPGVSGGFLFKASDTSVVSSSILKSKYLVLSSVDQEGNTIETTGLYPTIEGTSDGSIIHNSSNGGYLTASSWFGLGNAPSVAENLGGDIIGIHKEIVNSGESAPILYTDRIFIGPALPGYAGSILTHNGVSPPTWEQPDYLKAPGLYWNRYPRRAIEFIVDPASDSTDRLRFIDLDESRGGTGAVSLEDIEIEFAINETIAIYNQNREVFYVKVANLGLIDSRSEISTDFFTKEEDLLVTVCPEIPSSFYSTSAIDLGEDDPDTGRLIGYAFSVQKGAYMDMYIEPDATSGFSCENGLTADSEYRFKPSTMNTISIRPKIHTSFNKIAEDIDFVVYGNRKTLFTRYESNLFSPDSEGLPGGLIPALRVHASIENSYLGSLEKGIFRNTEEIDDSGQAVAITGVYPDLSPKITINMSQPFAINRINNVYTAVISPINDDPAAHLALEEKYGTIIPATGLAITGESPVSTYADLSVNGFTYSSGIISQELSLYPLWTGTVPVPYEDYISNSKIYIPNYPLTINNYGQIVSLVPPPNPELPSSPSNVTTYPKYNSIILTWDPPASNGGKPIFAYVVEVYDNQSNTWTPVEQVNGDLPVDPNPFRYRYITGLNASISYTFRVYAINEVGRSNPSNESAPTQPDINYPDVPLNVAVDRNTFDADITWSANPNTGLNDINSYIIKYAIASDNLSWKTAGIVDDEVTSITIPNIPEGPTYYFRVIAVSNYGESLPAEIKSVGTATPIEKPSTSTQLVDSFDFSGGPSGLGMMFTGVCY